MMKERQWLISVVGATILFVVALLLFQMFYEAPF
jgi:hypothetical protein